MKNSTESSRKGSSQRGMALIMVLLFLILTSALAFALLYKVNSEQKMQKSDSGNTAAFYAAEAGMEKLNADLIALYTVQAAPNYCDIQTVAAAANQPNQSFIGATYPDYEIVVPPGGGCALPPSHDQLITQGAQEGLHALVVPLTLQVTALRPSGEEVRMIRNIEIAEIPVFQFGLFSETDLSFYPGSTTDLNGRVQTNHNLFLTPAGTLTLHGPVRAAGDVIRNEMANGKDPSSDGHTGPVYLPMKPGGCDGTQPACRALSRTEGSASGGPTPANCDPAIQNEVGGPALCNGTPIGGWATLSSGGPAPPNYGSMILSGSTGAKALSLSFVQPGVGPDEIIRRPQPGDSPALTMSRLYNLAQIRVLLSDNPSELPADISYRASGSDLCANPCTDPNIVRLTNDSPNQNGIPIEGPTNYMMFAEGTTDTTSMSETDWGTPPGTIPSAVQTMVPNTAPIRSTGLPTTWNLLDGYLRVEIRQADGSYKGVTQQWLGYGFARGYEPPMTPGSNPVTPDAILILQHLADRNANGSIDAAIPPSSSTTHNGPTCQKVAPTCPVGAVQTNLIKGSSCGGSKFNWTYDCTTTTPGTPPELVAGTAGSYYYGTATRNNWYPNNFYDPREGQWRSPKVTTTQCNVNGVMNAVDIDVYNLRRWLLGASPYGSGSGPLTESSSQNGYVLYFSDRRGMLPNPDKGIKDGEYGFEDVINTASSSGKPDGILEDGENVNGSHVGTVQTLDTWGAQNVGYGFGAAANHNPAAQVDCLGTARKNWVSGARHVVRLVDGQRGDLPTKSDGTGGFTLASENPAYVIGDYNAKTSETGNAQATPPDGTYANAHASAAVISDALTLLTNNFTDLRTFRFPADASQRPGVTTHYRMAIATGKNMNYPYNATNAMGDQDFGSDGGMHNFLHYIEDNSPATISYLGSMVSLYYSTYATGVFKCCAAVYGVPTRDYGFDPDFLDLNKMPPGTPRFRDVVNLGFQQVF